MASDTQSSPGPADRAAAVVEAARREAADLGRVIEAALDQSGVDREALAETAREKLTAFERLASEELARRPLRTLALAAGIGAVIGALIAR